MKSLPVAVAIVALTGLLRPSTLLAQQAPFVMPKQYSADIIMTAKTGFNIETRTFLDGDKLRSELHRDGVTIATIVRKDKKKLYHVIEAQKMVMESNYDPAKAPANSPAVFGPVGKFDPMGQEIVGGVATIKYKVTSPDGKVNYFWMDPVAKAPVQMTSSDGSMTVQWRNFKPGPQDPALFEPPANFQVMNAPAGGGQ